MTQTLFSKSEPCLTGAEFSPCRTYRYALWRFWGDDCNCRRVAFIGLNPSTADETEDDPTIRRCIGFAKRWGFDGLYMLNAFAFRATDPNVMCAAKDPIGPDNDRLLRFYSDRCELIVACWGANIFNQRDEQVKEALDRRIDCLGLTKLGHPKHPLYLRSDTKLEHYWSPAQ